MMGSMITKSTHRKAPSQQDLPVLPSNFKVVNLRDAEGEGDYAITVQDLAGALGRDYETLRVQVRRLGIQRYLDPEDRRRVVIDWREIPRLVKMRTRGKTVRPVIAKDLETGRIIVMDLPMPKET
jgi:hypothetical protein